MCHYTHFTTEERELSRGLKTQGFSVRAIAQMLNWLSSLARHIAQKFSRKFCKRGYISIFTQKISTVTITCFRKDLCPQVAL